MVFPESEALRIYEEYSESLTLDFYDEYHMDEIFPNKIFLCPDCGCKFEASNREYYIKQRRYPRDYPYYFACKCPQCPHEGIELTEE